MFVIVHNDTVILGPMPWRKAFFENTILDDLELVVSLPYTNDQPLVINATLRILPAVYTEDLYNSNVQKLNGPFWTFTDTLATGHFVAVDKTVDEVKGNLRQLAKDKRKAAEIGGVDISGIKVATDPESQAKITGAWATVQMNPNTIINWKGDNGWIQLNATAVNGIASAVSTHVQNCFTAEKAEIDAIEACTSLAELNAMFPVPEGL